MQNDYTKLTGKIIKWAYRNHEACYLISSVTKLKSKFDGSYYKIGYLKLYDEDDTFEGKQLLFYSEKWLNLQDLFINEELIPCYKNDVVQIKIEIINF